MNLILDSFFEMYNELILVFRVIDLLLSLLFSSLFRICGIVVRETYLILDNGCDVDGHHKIA